MWLKLGHFRLLKVTRVGLIVNCYLTARAESPTPPMSLSVGCCRRSRLLHGVVVLCCELKGEVRMGGWVWWLSWWQ